jgi:uncharacterized MAPEG superfamily protein
LTMQNGISLVVAILACAQGAHAQVGVDTKSVVQHQWYAAAIITLAWLIMTIIIAFMQGVTRLMAGGKVPGRMTAREDEYFGCLFGNSMLSPQARENRQKLANRMQNIAQNSYEMPVLCVILVWTSLFAVYSGAFNRQAEYGDKIVQLYLSFLVFRIAWFFTYLAGINFTFLPLRSLFWWASMTSALVAGLLGMAAALEIVNTADAGGVICDDGVGCVCRTGGCLVGALIGAIAGFILVVGLLMYVILSWRPFSMPPPMVMTPPPFMGPPVVGY